MLVIHFCYYPKWTQEQTEATISWDVSGYYMYLPAIFIYHDLKSCSFQKAIIEKYKPTPVFNQAYKDEVTDDFVMKYSIWQAIVFLPSFLTAHLFAILATNILLMGFQSLINFLSRWVLCS